MRFPTQENGMAPASVGCQAAQMEEPRDTPLSLPRSAPGRVPPQESQPLTCHCGPSLLLSVALPPAGARGGRAALPAWGFRAFVLCRPPWVSSVYSRRDRKSLPGLAPGPGELPQTWCPENRPLQPYIPGGRPSPGNSNLWQSQFLQDLFQESCLGKAGGSGSSPSFPLV